MRIRPLAAALALVAALPAATPAGSCPYTTQECLDYMATKMKDSGWVGVELESVDDGTPGMTVTRVVEGSPAEAAGIQVGDVLVAINGIKVNFDKESSEKLSKAREAQKPGSDVVWTMTRDSSPRDLQITLGRMPADVLARFIGEHMLLEHADVAVAAKDPEGPESSTDGS